MPTFLHAACGSNTKRATTKLFSQDDWREVRMDVHAAHQPDIVSHLTDMSSLQSDMYDAIFTAHSLEKLYAHEVPLAFKNMLRVLHPDGHLIAICTDLQSVCSLVAEDKLLEPAYESPSGPISPIDMLFGYRAALAAGHTQFANHCGFTSKALIGTLAQVGFASVWSTRNPQTFTLAIIATKKETTEDRIKELAQQHFSK